MDQTSSVALIASIIAVVLGALGLVGGIIGYVQGTAALRRATLTRQRAAAAEEAALGARAQAEQSARIAQDALDRISRLQLRSLGDVADQPTGPLLLPSRAVAGRASEVVAIEPATGPTALAAGPAAVQPLESSEAAQSSEPRDVLVPSELPEAVRPSEALAPSEPREAQRASEAPTSEPATSEPATRAALADEPPVATPLDSADPDAGQVTSPTPPPEEPRAPRHATGPIPVGTASAPTRSPIRESPREDVRPPEPDSATAPVPADPADAPGESDEDPAAPARSSTGQITAGAQEAPPMDWAEVLRTGAIPLPTRSRGTYAAPEKGRKRATGPARFEIRAVGRQRFEVVNVGAEEAQLAVVEGAGEDRHLVRPVQLRPVAVAPGDSLAFSLLRVEGRQVSVQVTWQRAGEDQSAELPLP